MITHSRVEEVAEIGDRDADRPAGVGDQPLRGGVAGGAELEQPARRDLLAAARREQRGDRPRRRQRLEAAAVAAAADRPAVHEHRVADLAGGPAIPC